jgi:hypothetical protein
MLTRDLEALPERCALRSRILWWKTVTLQTAYVTAMITLALAAILLILGQLRTVRESHPATQLRVAAVSRSKRASTSATIAPNIALILKSFGV